jgi:hypothetical protein
MSALANPGLPFGERRQRVMEFALVQVGLRHRDHAARPRLPHRFGRVAYLADHPANRLQQVVTADLLWQPAIEEKGWRATRSYWNDARAMKSDTGCRKLE